MIQSEFMKKAIDGVLILRPDCTPEDVYVVWFCKTLQNWKALISTNKADTEYFEVTYNGDKKQMYIDTYVKKENVTIDDEVYPSDRITRQELKDLSKL